jgi:4-hydroxythreonine-4-phosphate dehydrogenase
MALPLFAIALGDMTGIGPEVALKAIAAQLPAQEARYLILGDTDCARRWNERLKLRLPLKPFTSPAAPGRVFVHNPAGAPMPDALQPGAPEAARAAMTWLQDGADRCLRGETAALITAPVNKAAIQRAGFPDFAGQTEHLSHLAGANRTVMMLLGPDERGRWLRVALATTHVPLKEVAARLSTEKIEAAIELAAGACRRLGLARGRIGVCGLNPHAGEEGLLGTEEQEMIVPAVKAAQEAGLEVTGPLAADALFHQAWRGDFEAVVAMYHDQGLGPLKMVAFERGVNWTLGLPFIRTSPDHGTAYDIAGRGVANPSSMTAALQLAAQLARTAWSGSR